MKFSPLTIEGAWLAESSVWPDERGFFREWFKKDEIRNSTGIDFDAKQANFSVSNKNVIRGIHYSLAPGGQAKWITCVSGAIIDVVVDLRPNSPTFKKVEYIELESGDGKTLLIGSGLGHGFLSREDDSGIAYLLSSPYAPDYEFDISPTDLELGIKWQQDNDKGTEFILSKKDSDAPTLNMRLKQGNLPV